MADICDVSADELRDHCVTEYTDYELHSQYDEFLDDIHETPNWLCGSPSVLIRETSPTDYRCGFSDWLDSERDRIVEVDGDYFDADEVEAYEPEGSCDECGCECPIDEDLCEDCEEEMGEEAGTATA